MDTRSRRLAHMAAASLFAWYGGVAAQPAPIEAPLNLAEAIRLALAQPALRAAAHEAAAGAAMLDQAGRYPNPELSWLREGQDSGTRTTTAQLSQTIELGGKRQARLALAQGEAALAQAELAVRRRETRAEVIAAYYAVLVAARQQQVARDLAGLARRAVDVATRRVAAGKVSPIDATKARLAALDAATELTRAGAELAMARARLGALTGRTADAVAPTGAEADANTGADDALPVLAPLATLLARSGAAGAAGATGNAGAVALARGRLATQEAQAGIERAARIPDLTLTLGTQRDDQAGRRQAVFGVALPLPLFDRNQGRLTAALLRGDKARDELEAAQIELARGLAEAHARYGAAREEATLLQAEVIPGARSAWELTLKGFEAGKFAFLDVLDAQRTWFQARSRHAAALLAAWRAYADIERLAGAVPEQN